MLKYSEVFKRVFSVILIFVLLLCFSFNAFGLDIISKTQDPQIEIDGRDAEMTWIENTAINFDIPPDVGSWLSVEMFNYQNSIYGIVVFNDAVESDTNLVVRIDFHYKKYSAYAIFVMQDKLVLWESDSLVFDGVIQQNISNYCAEFSVSTKQSNPFSQGDLVQIEVKYGCVEEIEDYSKMIGFYEIEIFDCYIGGQYIEPETAKTTKSTTRKTTKPKTTKTKTTKAKTTKDTTVGEIIVENQTDNDANLNYNANVIDDIISTKDLTVILSVGAIVIVVTIIMSFVLRKSDDRKNHNYTDEDKGCD